MIALRPPSYHTIEDPPPYPDDDDDDDEDADERSLADVDHKRPSWRPPSDNRSVTPAADRAASTWRHLANCGEVTPRLGNGDDDADQRVIRQAVRQYRDAVGHRHRPSRAEPPPTSRQRAGSAGGQTDTTTTWRLDGSTTNDRWQYDRRRPRLPAGGGGGGPFSPCTTIAQGDSDRSGGVPYSVTCPSRFDGGLDDAAAVGCPRSIPPPPPRPSSSGEPVASGPAGDRRPRRQASSVFEISSYIIAGGGAADAPVQPSVAADDL